MVDVQGKQKLSDGPAVTTEIADRGKAHLPSKDAVRVESRVCSILEEVARLGAQLLMQAASEAEVTEFLGRDRYQRCATAPDAQPGARNGYRPATVKTTAGPVTLERPKLRGTMVAFASRLFGKARHQDQCAGIVGDRLVRTRAVGA